MTERGGWFAFLPWWARLYWLTSAGDAVVRIPWPRRVRAAGGRAWVEAYMAWKAAGYPEA